MERYVRAMSVICYVDHTDVYNLSKSARDFVTKYDYTPLCYPPYAIIHHPRLSTALDHLTLDYPLHPIIRAPPLSATLDHRLPSII